MFLFQALFPLVILYFSTFDVAFYLHLVCLLLWYEMMRSLRANSGNWRHHHTRTHTLHTATYTLGDHVHKGALWSVLVNKHFENNFLIKHLQKLSFILYPALFTSFQSSLSSLPLLAHCCISYILVATDIRCRYAYHCYYDQFISHVHHNNVFLSAITL